VLVEKGPSRAGAKIHSDRYTTTLFLRGAKSMPQGTIKKLISEKGFGFIAGERGELFFHHSAVEGTAIEDLHEGQAVEYTEGRGPKGPRAENVRAV
jgi:cold shock protein